MTALIVHGHFYQPPRENPWTGIIDQEPSAHPFHDWNERIHAECYQANAFARLVDSEFGEEKVVNNYELISFNFGPTLLSWLERYHAETYTRIFTADRESMGSRSGHGNAIAQAYNHTILPLDNERDRRTQVRWGLADFRHRFGREPLSMWLPELACNDAVLALLIDEGLRFVILAPHQAARVRSNRTVIPAFQGGTDIPVCHHEGNPSTENQWQNVLDGTIDTSIAYQYFHRDGSGRSLAVVFYDDEISRAIAFEQALTSSSSLVDRFERRRIGKGDLLSIATDGESYGHHHKFGDLCLAHTLNIEAPSRGFRVTNFGEYFDQYPPTKEVEISAGPAGEGTSWSCPHGVSRWIRDCGCQTDGEPGWNQAWRQPLRKAFDFVRDEAAKYFEETRGRLFVDPWSARNEAIELILDPFKSREEFLQRQAPTFLNSEEQKRALGFLELQRNTMLMYTSCAWFFNDISGLEPIQILKYASRSIDLMNQLGLPPVRDRFLEILAEARSNRPQDGNGADIYKRFVEPASPSFDLNSKKLSGMPA